MKFPVVKKLFVLVLSIAVGLLTNSYARNDRKGGHSSGFAHAAGGHGGGRRGAFAGRSGGHAVRSVHLRTAGSAARRAVTRGSVSRSEAGQTRTVSQAQVRNGASSRATTDQTKASTGRPLASQSFAQPFTRAGARNTSRTALSAVSNGRNANWSRDRSLQWHQAVADRKEYWNKWTNDNRAQLRNFHATRDPQWSHIAHWWNDRLALTRMPIGNRLASGH